MAIMAKNCEAAVRTVY